MVLMLFRLSSFLAAIIATLLETGVASGQPQCATTLSDAKVRFFADPTVDHAVESVASV
jgi:hypothetical protein